MIRVLLAEDSPTARALLLEILNSDPGIDVIGVANDGEEAVALAKTLRPDVILMDVQMPKMDGITATRVIMDEQPVPIVIVSANVDVREVAVSMNALKAGALALVPKPAGPTSRQFDAERRELLATVKAMSHVKLLRRGEHRVRDAVDANPLAARTATVQRPRVIAIAGSTGAPSVLQKLLAVLPRDFPVPVLIVQHIAVGFSDGFVHWLNTGSQLKVQLAASGETLKPGTAYVCPDNKHLLAGPAGVCLLSDAVMVGGFRPSATLLFQSVAEIYGPAVLALILSGMGRDGADGLQAVKRVGGRVLAQNEASCVVYGMPKVAVEAGWVDESVAPEDMARKLIASVSVRP